MHEVTQPPSVRASGVTRSPLRRRAEFTVGLVLVIVTPAVAVLPGPGGTLVFAGGMVLILRNSVWARQRWARLKRCYPRIGDFIDRMMRRRSALRRHARDKAERDGTSHDGAAHDGAAAEN